MSISPKESWYLYHKPDKKKYGPYFLEALCQFIKSEKLEIEVILLCHTSCREWLPAIDKKIFLEQYQTIKPIPNECLSKDNLEAGLELKVTFILNNKTFRTKTKHLSLEGIMIKDTLPEHFREEEFEIYISSPDLQLSIKFQAKFEDDSSIKFSSKNDIGLKHLDSWMNKIPLKKSA